MNNVDRHKITRHLIELVELTKLDLVLPRLIQKTVFTESMAERFKNKLIPERERKRDLYLSIQKRGPNAFALLIEALEETAHYNVARILADNPLPGAMYMNNITGSETSNERISAVSSNLSQSSQHIHPYVLPPNSNTEALKETARENQAQIDMSNNVTEIKVKPSTEFYDTIDAEETKYPMRSEKRGVYLIINNIEFVNNCEEYRHGAAVDHNNLLELFKQMGFIGQDWMNLNHNEMKTKITDFAADNELLNRTDSCIIVIMSHGNDYYRDGYVFSKDHIPLYLSWITDCFNNRNCPLLRNIPKIFLFQCCRGDISDNTLNETNLRFSKSDVMSDSGGAILRAMPTYSDMLICHSTVPGFQSYREAETGTWYINTICNIWAEFACNTDVERLMKMVADKFRNLLTLDNKMQTPYFENISFNTCYFHPGLYLKG